MRVAILSATSTGAVLAQKIKENWAGTDTFQIFLRAEDNRMDRDGQQSYMHIMPLVQHLFLIYDALVFVMATGIVLRALAPCLRNKIQDPAVVVVDEAGQHAISLLSGHVGGANDLARRIAAHLGAEAVITTATDVQGKTAPDLLAARLALQPWPKTGIKTMNALLLRGVHLSYVIDETLPRQDFYRRELQRQGIESQICPSSEWMNFREPCIVLTEKKDWPEAARRLYLSPRRLVAGIGCRRGTPAECLFESLAKACQMIGQDITAVSVLASVDIKREEPGLQALGEKLSRTIRFFSAEELEKKITAYDLACSPFVKKTIGAGNVAEAAALCCVRAGRFALGKTKFEKVTVALIWEK